MSIDGVLTNEANINYKDYVVIDTIPAAGSNVPPTATVTLNVTMRERTPEEKVTSDLSNVAFAQEFNLANTGSYASSLEELQANSAKVISDGGSDPKITVSKDIAIYISVKDNDYIIVGVVDGQVYGRDSESGSVMSFGSIEEYQKATSPISSLPLPTIQG